MNLGFSMPQSGRMFALASLALHLQASFVLTALSVAVLDDGRMVVESAGEHVVRWHGATLAEHGRVAEGPSHAMCAPREGLPNHRHLSTGEVAAAPKRIEFEAGPTPVASPGVSWRQAVAVFGEIASHAPEPPAGRYAAAESAFSRVVLIV